MSLTLLRHLGDLGHWGQTRDEAGTGMHVAPQPRPCCATALGPAGSSCLSSEFLSGGNRQVNIPDQLIRIRCEATGLASQLCSWVLHRSTTEGTSVEHYWVRTEVGMLTLGRGTGHRCQVAPPKCTQCTSCHSQTSPWHGASPAHPSAPRRHGMGPCYEEQTHGSSWIFGTKKNPLEKR